MSLQHPKAGPSDVPSYSVSAIPWVTASSLGASEVRSYSLPAVSRFIHVRNVGATGSFVMGFTTNGVNGNPASETRYLSVLASSSLPVLELRVKEVFLRATAGTPAFELLVGLTNIRHDVFPALTASMTASNPNLFSGVG